MKKKTERAVKADVQTATAEYNAKLATAVLTAEQKAELDYQEKNGGSIFLRLNTLRMMIEGTW